MKVNILKHIHLIEAEVESETREGAYYKVKCEEDKWSCTCAYNTHKKIKCKHIQEVADKI